MPNFRFLICATLVALTAATPLAAAQPRPLVLRGATVHTAVGAPLEDATIVVRDGRIAAVGRDVGVPADAEIVDVSGTHVIPGMLDEHSHIGFDIGDVNERSVRFAPRHRILDVLSPEDRFWGDAARGGVTTVVTGPGSGMVSSGQAAVVKTWGPDFRARILRERGGLKIAMGRKPPNMAPSSSMAVTSFLRAQFIRAQEYMESWRRWESGGRSGSPPTRDLDLDVLADVLRGDERVRSHVHSAHDILAILRLSDEFGFDLTLHHATEAHKVADEIARRGVNVVGMPLFLRVGVDESVMRGPVELVRRGIPFAFHTDDPVIASSQQRLNAALGIRYGMTELEALQAVTINPARMARVAERVGSIEVGKDADLVVLDGTWYELRTRVDRVYVNGLLAYDRAVEEAR